MAAYNFRMRAICGVSDIRTFLRLMLMAHSTWWTPCKMTGHLTRYKFFKLRRQSFCESHFDELFKRRFAFVDPCANQSAFPTIHNKCGKRASREVFGDLALCLCLGNDACNARGPSRKALGYADTNHLALIG